ncbi:MAG: pyridoxamine 5'-phosphate oxidase family protein [Bacteroidota bacterium]
MEKNLHSTEAVKKLKSLVESIGTCMFYTNISSGDHNTRPMAVIEVDMNGNLWFFTSVQSTKVKDIEKDSGVQLAFAHPGKDSYLDLRGLASIETDRKSIEEKWNPIVKAWFPEGKDDPNLCLVKVKTDEAHYWDTETTKMVEMIKIVSSVVSGKKLAEGVHGDLLV